MNNLVQHDIKNQRFYIQDNEKVKGEMTYAIGDSIMVINRTYVDPESRNIGYGRGLVDAGVEYAKSKQMKIRPTCPYAYTIIDNNYGGIMDRLSNHR